MTARRSAQTSDFTLSSLKDPPWEMIGAASEQQRPASTQFWLATPDYCYSLPAAAGI